MKKTSEYVKVFFLLSIFASIICTGCASSKKSKSLVDEDLTVINENEETDTNTDSSKKSKKEKNNKKKKSKDKAEGANFSGWISTDKRPIVKDMGIIRLRAIPTLGSFNISVINEKGKSIPVLTSSNEYASSSFYLATDKKKYKLTAGSKVVTSAKKTNTGMYVDYRINNVAEVKVDFDCFASEEGRDCDMVKVTATILNLSQKNRKYALKVILDTILGESYRNHFYTSDGMSVKSEKLIYGNGSDFERWIISKNSSAGMKLFLRGNDTSKIDQVQIANYSTLDTQNWYPNLTSFRAFDTVTSYNNSAIGINWPEFALAPGEKSTVVFYISLSANEIDPDGAVFMQASEINYEEESYDDVYEFEEVEENDLSYEVKTVEKSSEIPAEIQNVTSVEEVKVPEVKKEEIRTTKKNENRVEERKNVQTQKKVEKTKPEPMPEIQFDITSLTAEQLEPEYIQNLINRITVLEESGLAVNRAELLQLNAELDAILEILRKN